MGKKDIKVSKINYQSTIIKVKNTKNLNTDTVQVVQNGILQIDNELKAGTRIIAKIIDNTFDIDKLKNMKPSNLWNTTAYDSDIHKLGPLLLSDIWMKLEYDKVILQELTENLNTIIVNMYQKEFLKNDRYEHRRYTNLIEDRIEALQFKPDPEDMTI